MNARLGLPPSARDFEVYRLVKVEQRSTREAAEALQISQTRVCQVLDRVMAFLVEVAPAEDDGREAQKLRLAKCIAGERLDHYIQQAMEGFRQSQGHETTERDVESQMGGRATVRTTRTSRGDVRYLMTAARLTMLASKLPAAGFPLAAFATDDETQHAAHQEITASPLNEDCSARTAEQPQLAAAELETIDATARCADSCGRYEPAASVHANDNARPVQPLAEGRSSRKRRRDGLRKEARRRFLAAAG